MASALNPLRVTLAVCAAAAPLAAGTTYQITDLGTLGGGASYARDINNAGQVAGYATLPDTEALRAFRWDGTLTDLGAPAGQPQSLALSIDAGGAIGVFGYELGGIGGAGALDAGAQTWLGDFLPTDRNASGVIVGTQQHVGVDMIARQRAVRWSSGALAELPLLAAGTSQAEAINDLGWIVGGASGDGALAPRAMLWIADGPHDLGTLGGPYGFAHDINAAGHAVGITERADGVKHATLFAVTPGGQVTLRLDLGELGGSYSAAYGINAAGEVVGVSDGRAFIWKDGEMQDLNACLLSPDWQLQSAWAINDAGQIVGDGRHLGLPRAYLLTPAVCNGDADGDGEVELDDLLYVLGEFGSVGENLPGDVDGTGTVDLDDLLIVLGSWGTQC